MPAPRPSKAAEGGGVQGASPPLLGPTQVWSPTAEARAGRQTPGRIRFPLSSSASSERRPFFLTRPAVHSVCCSAWSCGGSRACRGDWGEGGGVWGGEGWAITGVEERNGAQTGRAEGELGVAPGSSAMGRL